MISDHTYKDLYTLLGGPERMMKFHKVKSNRDEWNGKIKTIFHPEETRDGTRVSLRAVITQILRLHTKANHPLPSTSQFKLCIDSRAIGIGQTAFAVVPINLRKTFPTQCPDSAFPFTIYRGSDTRENIVANIGSTKQEIRELDADGITIENRKTNITFIHSSDLKAMGECTDMSDDDCFCPFCRGTISERFNVRDRTLFNKKLRQLDDIFGVSRHVFCVLHAKQRITEYYLKQMIRGDESLMKKVELAARSIKGQQNFKIIEKSSK